MCSYSCDVVAIDDREALQNLFPAQPDPKKLFLAQKKIAHPPNGHSPNRVLT